MPIPLGILAAAGFRPTAGGSYELIETITVSGSSTSSVAFSNLNTYSSVYQHLQIRAVSRTSDTAGGFLAGLTFRINNDSGNNYAGHQLLGQGTAVESGSSTSQNNLSTIFIAGTNRAASNIFAPVVIDILDAYETNKNKTIRALAGLHTGGDAGGSNQVRLNSGLWMNTAAITSMSIATITGNFVAGSRFSIYGLKAS